MSDDRKPRSFLHLPPRAVSLLERAGQWLLVTVGFFAWWMAMQLLISLFLLNVWHVRFTQILIRSVWLTAASAAVYAGVMVWRERKKQADSGEDG